MTFLEEFKKPFNFISLILTIFSIFISFYFYFKSEKQKELTYIIEEPPSLIFDNSVSSPAIKILDKDSALIKENIYLLRGILWNSGDFSLEKKDIRTPLTIKLPSQSRIIDYKITQEKDPQISVFKLTKLNFNTLSIDWKYFDPNHGFRFQIIYTGKLDSLVSYEFLKGKILDIEKFNKSSNIKDKYTFSNFILIIPILILVIMGIFDLLKSAGNKIFYRIVGVVELLTGIIAFCTFMWQLFFMYQTPPF